MTLELAGGESFRLRSCIESMISIARDMRSSLRSPVTSKLLHRHAILHESHERTNGRATPRS